MPRIRCRYLDCVFLEDGYCGTSSVDLDPDEGCLTYTHLADVAEDEDWEEDELEEFWDEDEEDLFVEDEGDAEWLEEEEY
ncbi:MAG: hypothetical protein P1P76_04990 [Anaerolineales bacterium]|nr:hypothetical protein [Anaerolineales bacterium]